MIVCTVDCCIITIYTAGMAGYDTLIVQQYDVYNDLADILETDFTEGNEILTEMQDFYRSCIVAEQMNQTVAIILPVRKFFQGLGQFCDSIIMCTKTLCMLYIHRKETRFILTLGPRNVVCGP